MSSNKFIFRLAFSLAILVVLAACTQNSLDDEITSTRDTQETVTETEVATSTAEPITPNIPQETASTEDDVATEQTLLAGTNIAKHSVPLEDVVFDTFNGSYNPPVGHYRGHGAATARRYPPDSQSQVHRRRNG